MSNSITATAKYVAVLDEAAEHGLLTAVLKPNEAMVKADPENVDAGEYKIAKQTLVGLGDYTTAYPEGDVTLEWETHSFSYDRGRKFSVDKVDNAEAAGQAFGPIASRFVRKHVVPEIDAVRFGLIAQNAATDAYAILTTSDAMVAAVDTATAALGDAGVSEEDLVLFLTYANYNLLKNSDLANRLTPPGADPDARFGRWDGIQIVKVPTNRFYSEFVLNAGSTSSAGGYVNAGGALNFILMDRGATAPIAKHAEPRLWSPNGEGGIPVNPDANAWRFDYRLYHDIFIPDNAKEGIYVHAQTDVVS